MKILKPMYLAMLLIASGAVHAAENILRAADVLTYTQLKSEKLSLSERDKYCCSSSNGTSFWVTDMVHFKPKDDYYVRVTIDARALANEILAMSCEPKGLFDSSKKCSTRELDAKIKKALDNMVYGDLYGKYKNTWDMFEADGARVPLTAKFGGHDVYRFERKDGIDTLILGPVLKLPARLQLRFFDTHPKQEIAVETTFAPRRK